VGGLKHENNTVRIRLYLSSPPITTEKGINTTSFLHPYFPLLNHPAHKKEEKFKNEASPIILKNSFN